MPWADQLAPKPSHYEAKSHSFITIAEPCWAMATLYEGLARLLPSRRSRVSVLELWSMFCTRNLFKFFWSGALQLGAFTQLLPFTALHPLHNGWMKTYTNKCHTFTDLRSVLIVEAAFRSTSSSLAPWTSLESTIDCLGTHNVTVSNFVLSLLWEKHLKDHHCTEDSSGNT